jgi:2'-5' RNA ligase
MSPFVGQRVALGPRTGAIIDIGSLVTVHFDSGGVEDVDPNTLHYAELDYPELTDVVWDHPSPEKALEGDPYINLRSRYRRPKTASDATSLSASTTGDSGQMHTDIGATPGPIPSVDFIPYEPGVLCSYCNERPAQVTVNGASLCLWDAEHRWGIPVADAVKANGAEDYLSSATEVPEEATSDQDDIVPSEEHTASTINHSGSAMVSLDLEPGSFGSTEDPPHITLVYLGKGLGGPRLEEIAQRLSQLAAGTPGPLEGTVGGLGTFVPSASSDWKTPVFAVPQVEGLSDLRAHLEDLNASEHGDFQPHVTLDYLDEGDPLPPPTEPTPVSFTHLTLHHGDDVRHFPFAGKLGARKAPGYHTDKFYHGSPHDFEPGDEVRPGLDPAHHPGVSNDVWVADNAWVGSTYGHNTYEVTPHGPTKKTGKSGEFTTSGATVVRKVPNSEVLEHANKWYDPKWRPPVHEAAWRDVMDKAKRLRETNAVHLLEVPSPDSPYVFAEVKGDNATHHCFVAVKGTEQGQWSCSCPWGDFGPNGPLAGDRAAGSPYRKTPCSHILATRWELQSRSMFGRNPYTGALAAKQTLFHGSPTHGLTVLHHDPVEHQYDNATSQFGAFLTPEAKDAEYYAGEKGQVYQGDVDLKKPYQMPWREFNYYQSPDKDKEGGRVPGERWGERLDELRDEAKQRRAELEQVGHDGIVLDRGAHRPAEIASFRDVPVRPHTGAWHPSGIEDGERRTEDLDHVIHHFKFSDGDNWHEVLDNYDFDHPIWRGREADVKRNGVREPVPVDYGQEPPKVLDGHTRLALAQRVGLKQVPTQHYDEMHYHIDHPYGEGEGFGKESAMDVLADWFAGRFFHEGAPPQEEMEGWLAPHRNPEGTEWKSKAAPGSYGRNPRATHFDDLDEKTQGKVRNNVHGALAEAPTIPNTSVPGGTRNPMPAKAYSPPKDQHDIVHNIEGMYHNAKAAEDNGGPKYVSQGGRWYHQAHEQVKSWAKDYGVDHYHMNGATAALSPSTDWDSNLTMAHYYAKHLGSKTNETFRMAKDHKSYNSDKARAATDGVDLDSLEGKSFHGMSDVEAHHALKHQALRVDKVKRASGGPMVENPTWGPSWQSSKNGSRAVQIMRGRTPDDTPDKLLSGHKVRSFHNNLYHPGHTDDVTVDSHATSLALGAKMGASSKTLKKVLEFGDSNREKSSNSRGSYSYLADSYRKAHANLVNQGHMSADSTPADLQAITWKRWRDLMPPKSAGKKGHTSTEHTEKNAYPVLAALRTDDDEHHDDPEHFLDPFGGPDELDPDLHATEEEGWEDEEEPNEEDHDDVDDYGDDDYDDMLTDRHKEGAMYNWAQELRQARRERLAAATQVQPAQVPAQPIRPVPVQYLSQVPHHLSSGMDEFGFEPHQANAPSEHWQEQHSPGADNPGDTAPPGFGDNLDPASGHQGPYNDERMLEPGPVINNPLRGMEQWWNSNDYVSSLHVQAGPGSVYAQGGGGSSSYVMGQTMATSQNGAVFVQAPSSQPLPNPDITGEGPGAAQVLAEHQAGLEWLRPPGGAPMGLPEASGGTSREAMVAQHTADKAQLASAADAFLRTGSIPVPGFEVNMDNIFDLPTGALSGMEHDARSRDFTPAEQDEMVREGELEGVRASNLGLLRLEGSMYEELERQLSTDDQAQAAANALWW